VRGPATSFLNRFAAILTVVVVVIHVGPDLPGQMADALRARPKVAVAPMADLPDIYILLLDGYPRADVLDRKFGIDNTPFLQALTRQGFDVATDSHSNYVFTQLTLASVFQMRHLEDVGSLAPLIGSPGAHVNALRNATIDSPVFDALGAGGYQVVVTQPGYEHVALRAAADRVLEHGEMNDLERDVLKRTWLLDPLGWIFPTLFTGPPRDRVIHAFNDLALLAAESRSAPLFAWIHVPAPHLPLVLDATGRPLDLAPRLFDGRSAADYHMTAEAFATAYADELTYLNRRVLTSIKALTAHPGRPAPIIVLMSDHGYNTDLADTQARLSNLFAASTPEAPGLFKDAPTPVNLMPILLNHFLGTHLPMSVDRFFLSPSDHELLELTEVSNPG
jgi:sulfatase-like protein